MTDSSALSKVLFRRDGGEWKELTFGESRGVYYTLWKTSLADNGAHVYEIRAVDALGNERTASYSVTVANKDYSWVAWVILLVLVVLVVAYVRHQPAAEAPRGGPRRPGAGTGRASPAGGIAFQLRPPGRGAAPGEGAGNAPRGWNIGSAGYQGCSQDDGTNDGRNDAKHDVPDEGKLLRPFGDVTAYGCGLRRSPEGIRERHKTRMG